MKEIIDKLLIIKDEINSEKKNGILRFFGLIARTDIEEKWDLLISADWVTKSNSEADLVYIINKLKNQFGNKLEFLSTIVLLTPNESFVRDLARNIKIEGAIFPQEFKELKTSNDFIVKELIVLAMDFNNIDLSAIETDEREPVASKDVANF